MTSPHIDLYIQDESDNSHRNYQKKADGAGSKMSENHEIPQDHQEPGLYEIRIRGSLDDRWAAWFDGLTLIREDNGDTRITGMVVDQAALHGLLRRVRDLGVPLISVNRLGSGHTGE